MRCQGLSSILFAAVFTDRFIDLIGDITDPLEVKIQVVVGTLVLEVQARSAQLDADTAPMILTDLELYAFQIFGAHTGDGP